MTDAITIQPISVFDATLRLPGSKSLTNRALLLAALAQGDSVLRGPLIADDTQRMIEALRVLEIPVEFSKEHPHPSPLPKKGEGVGELRVGGRGGALTHCYVALDLGNAGTAMRPLCAACCLGTGRYTLDGEPRMRQRPIGELVEPLRQIGAEITYADRQGFPPVIVRGTGLRGGEITMAPTLSSQFITALLMVGPYCEKGLTIRFTGPITSRPYVEMTLRLMTRFGASAEAAPDWSMVRVDPVRYQATTYDIEPDASNASYFLAAAAVIPGSKVTIQGLSAASLQGDVAFADVLHRMGADLIFGRDFITLMSPPRGQPLRGIDIDLNHMPDMAQTLAAIAPLCQGRTAIRNVGNLRVKETDRMEALRIELTKLGATVTIQGDDLLIDPPADNRIRPAAIDTYNDHRMAMSFAVLGLAQEGVAINDPGCVAKTFPDFFEYLAGLGKSHR
ncbi:MAG: 3-phosphoshikimate 1-carboxyvinyltransferase [Phycisphaeraceae bacterium]